LLHDLAKLQPGHALLARDLLANLGLPQLGMVVGHHMVIAPELPRQPGISEAELVYLADKLVADSGLVGLEERKARALRNTRPDAAAARRIEARIADARLIAGKVSAILGTSLEDVLAPEVAPREVEAGGGGMELQLFLGRHAESSAQTDRRFVGQADPPLNAVGREQAKALAHTLMGLTGGACFDAVHSSDLLRCLQTAQIIAAECRGSVRTHTWLREIDVGLWEGLTWDEARRGYPAKHARREKDLVGEPFPRGESFGDLRARVMPAFLRLLDEALAAGTRRMLVVGHKGVNRVILAYSLGLPLDDLFTVEQEYCAVTVLRVTSDAGGGRRVTVEQRL
jgi:broad specificity phosphatase PhoE